MHQWALWAERVAFGELEIKPRDFYNMSPFEFEVMRTAKAQSQDRFWAKAGLVAFYIARDVMATKGKLKLNEVQDFLVSDEAKIRERVEKELAFKKDFEKGGD